MPYYIKKKKSDKTKETDRETFYINQKTEV